jgi:predicted 3-demethylubiquinone-9 3-methyltransferase (glyoxalase superfamily)
MQAIHPFLWFESGADEAAALYVDVLGGSILAKREWGPGGPVPEGSLMSVSFEIAGAQYEAFNGGPHEPFNDSFSMWVTVDDQDELDRIWDGLIAGGGAGIACGWLHDRFGVRWQIVPSALGELMSDPDPGRSARATQAMLGMIKLDIAALRAAADG